MNRTFAIVAIALALAACGASPAANSAADAQPYGPAPNGVDQTWFNNYVAAQAAQEKAVGNGNFWSWVSGSGRDAAIAQARATAPEAYFKMLQLRRQ
jgi:ABC-type sugar transport system substrate-binding protein